MQKLHVQRPPVKLHQKPLQTSPIFSSDGRVCEQLKLAVDVPMSWVGFPFLVPCHHQEYLRGLSKPAFATNIGKGDNPSYLPGIEDRLVLLDAQPLFESVSTSPLSELKHGWPRVVGGEFVFGAFFCGWSQLKTEWEVFGKYLDPQNTKMNLKLHPFLHTPVN